MQKITQLSQKRTAPKPVKHLGSAVSLDMASHIAEAHCELAIAQTELHALLSANTHADLKAGMDQIRNTMSEWGRITATMAQKIGDV